MIHLWIEALIFQMLLPHPYYIFFQQENTCHHFMILYIIWIQAARTGQNLVILLLHYGDNQLVIASSCNEAFHVVSIFGTEKTWSKDVANIHESIKRIDSYIKNHPVDKNLPSGDFIPVVKSLWKLIETIYASKWYVFTFKKEASLTIWKCVRESIMLFYRKQESSTSNSVNSKEKSTILNPIISPPSTVVSPPPTTNLPVAPPSNKNIESVVKKTLKPSNIRKFYV